MKRKYEVQFPTNPILNNKIKKKLNQPWLAYQ
jgi:hypothetical protein